MPLAGGQGGFWPNWNFGFQLTLFQSGGGRGQIMTAALLLAHKDLEI